MAPKARKFFVFYFSSWDQFLDVLRKKNQIFGKEPNKIFEPKQCEKEPKKNQKNQTKYSKPNAFKNNQIWGVWFQRNQTGNPVELSKPIEPLAFILGASRWLCNVSKNSNIT